MKRTFIILIFSFNFCLAQNVLIEPSGITPTPGGGSIWTVNSGDIMYSTGKVNIGTAANTDRLNIRSSIGENPLRVQVGGSTKLRVYANGAVSLNGIWGSPIANTTRIAGKAIVAGKLNVGSDNSTDEAGDIRWNNTSEDFEGFDGINWVSLTRGYTSTGSANTGPPTSPMSTDQQVVPPVTGTELFFGSSVSISGDFAIISEKSKIHFYEYNGSTWSFHSTPNISVPLSSYSRVAIDGNFAIVGDYSGEDAIVLKYSTTNDTWSEYQVLTPSDAGGRFGKSVEISEKYIIVGASYRTNNGTADAGGAYVFYYDAGLWVEQAILVHPDFESGDNWGWDVAISENYAMLGSIYEDSAYVFQRSGTVWGFTQVLTAANTSRFGGAISLSGDYVVIGDYYHNSTVGAAFVFQNINGIWTETEKLTASVDHGKPLYFGYDVDIKGDYIIVGEKAYTKQGWSYIFHFDGTDWVETRIIEDPLGQGGTTNNLNDDFGVSVSIDSANWVSGAPGADSNGYLDQGKVIFGPVE